MIPFSHLEDSNGNPTNQRLNRLKVQSTFYNNGYQHDWYGFNYGSLIGSFNGVSWFAIGKTEESRPLHQNYFWPLMLPLPI